MFKLLTICLLFFLCAGVTAKNSLAAQQDEGTNQPGIIVFETSLGDIEIELFDKEAPISSANFRKYVTDGFYDGLIFHRVIPGFVIQGGGFTPDLQRKGTRSPIQNEADNGLKNLRGTLSMARTPELHSATSQFFINLSDNSSLDHRGNSFQMFGYAVFGRVTAGMEVVDKIAEQETTIKGGMQDVPSEEIVIIRAYEK